MDGVPDWQPGLPCPCGYEGCGVVCFKLNRFGHGSQVCKCRQCQGRNANRRGKDKQSRALKEMAVALGRPMDRAPTHEEHARLGEISIEVKSGRQIPATLDGAFVRHAERQAEKSAEGLTRYWAVVYDMPEGKRKLMMDYDQFIKYVEELRHEARDAR